MSRSETDRFVIESQRGCPECGGTEWLPLDSDGTPIELVLLTALVDTGGVGDGLDLCLTCGIVVTG